MSFWKAGKWNARRFPHFYYTVLMSKTSLLVCGDLCSISKASHIKHLKGVIFCKLKVQTWMRPLFQLCGQRQSQSDGWETENFPILPQACMKSDLECVCWNNSYGRVNSTNTTCWWLWEILRVGFTFQAAAWRSLTLKDSELDIIWSPFHPFQ